MKLFDFIKRMFNHKQNDKSIEQNDEYVEHDGELYKVRINKNGRKFIMAHPKNGNKPYYKYVK